MANEFLIRISADDKATATIKKIEAAIAGIMSPLEKAQNKASRLGSVGHAGMEKLHAGLERVQSATRNLVDGLASIVPGLAAISGAVSVAGLAALADRFASVGFNLGQTSNILGVSRQELQAWQIVGKKAHMTTEEVSSGIMSMNEAIRGADIGTNSGAANTLAALGVKIQHKEDGKIDYAATRKAIVDAVARQEQASGRVAAANSLGVPIKLAENKNILKDFDAAMNSPLQQSDDAADRAREMQERIDALKMSIESVALTIGDKLVPVLQPAVEAIGKWFDKNKEAIANSIAAAVERFSNWLQKIDWEAVTTKAQKFWDVIGGIQGAAIIIAGLTFAGPIAGLLSILVSLTKIAGLLGGAALSSFFGLPGAAAAGAGVVADTAAAAAAAGTGIGLVTAGVTAAAAAAALYGGYKLGGYALDNDREYHDSNPELRSGSLKGRRTALLPTGSTGGGPTVEELIKHLMGKGWTKEQAAGIVGNLMQESSLNPNATNGSHYGLAQWDSARQADYEKLNGSKMVGSSWQKQADFIDYELREGKEKAAGEALARQKDPAQSARVFNQGYERPGMFDASGPRREANAIAASKIEIPKTEFSVAPEINIQNTETSPSPQVDTSKREASANPEIHINVTAPPGTRVEARDKDGTSLRARVTHSMAADGSMP